jgi:hypothetical protein
MTNYRISKINYFTSSSVWTKIGRQDTTNVYDKAWGIMTHVGMATSGSVTLEGGGELYLQHLIAGQIYPCYPTAIRLSAGTGSVLS